MTATRPLDEYEPSDSYGSYHVVMPEGRWESSAPKSAEEPDEPVGAARVGTAAGIVAAVVAGAIPALVVDMPAALVAGLAAGVFGGLMGRELAAAHHDRKEE